MKPVIYFLGAMMLFMCWSNLAMAQNLSLKQRILMPGPLVSSHAEFEPNCDNCHESFQQAGMSTRCLDCHEDVAVDRKTLSGFHGKSMLALTSTCDNCHTDHEGREADILGLLPDRFNHQVTDFPLTGPHATTNCENCHVTESGFAQTDTFCAGCHLDNDIHQGALGKECESCHQVTAWTQTLPFDHSTTDFALSGKHEDLDCATCHLGQQYAFDDLSCIGCHQNSDIHLGVNGEACENCHGVEGWEAISFNHTDTGFTLNGSHADAACVSCHADGVEVTALSEFSTAGFADIRTCNSCHLSEDVHLGRNGNQCESCHQEQAWDEVLFDHATDTDFSLTGHHAELACTGCHTANLTNPLPTDCADCHFADDPHQDSRLALCDSCHNTVEWLAVSGFDHEFTTFPLLGMHQILGCENCHLDLHFNTTEDTCQDCHGLDDVHGGSMGQDCQQCHTPNAWNVWNFDHDQQTDFSLLGSHADLSCDGCHLPGSAPAQVEADCVGCHRTDDVHFGEFGSHCGECHTSENFTEPVLSGVRPWPR